MCAKPINNISGATTMADIYLAMPWSNTIDVVTIK